MILRQWEQVLDRTKTQTRRVAKPGECVKASSWHGDVILDAAAAVTDDAQGFHVVLKVFADGTSRYKYCAGRHYALVPKRGQPGIMMLGGIPSNENMGDEMTYVEAFRASRRDWKSAKVAMRRAGWREARVCIQSIRCEYLHDITPEDALAEGLVSSSAMDIAPQPGQYNKYWWYEGDTYTGHTVGHPEQALIDAYRHLWESINGKTAWKKNPIVWVYDIDWKLV